MAKTKKSNKTSPDGIGEVLKRMHCPFEVIPLHMRWYEAYSLSHSTAYRWAIKPAPLFENVYRRRKRPVDRSWRVGDTCVKVSEQWRFVYRTVDKAGKTVDRLLRARRDKEAARCLFEKAIEQFR